MPLKNTSDAYGCLSKSFHWLSAFLLISLASVGFYMTRLADGLDKWSLYNMHKVTGLFVLALLLIRFIWRQHNRLPKSSELSELENKIISMDAQDPIRLGFYDATEWLDLIVCC